MSERLTLLRSTLDQYRRPFHVLDLGGGVEPEQNIGQEIARNYDNAIVTVVEQDWRIGNFEPSPRTMVLRRHFTADDLARLATCEHFDVVLALNVLHWYGSEWRQAMDTIVRMGDRVFVQLPPVGETDAPNGDVLFDMHDHLGNAASGRIEMLGRTTQFPGHSPRPLWLVSGVRYGATYLSRTHFGAESDANIIVRSNFEQVFAANRKKKSKSFDWVPGLNLWNFVRLGGVWPERETVWDAIVDLRHDPSFGTHGDVVPWNMIYDGDRLTLIDGGDGWEGHRSDMDALAAALGTVAKEMDAVRQAEEQAEEQGATG